MNRRRVVARGRGTSACLSPCTSCTEAKALCSSPTCSRDADPANLKLHGCEATWTSLQAALGRQSHLQK
eukprot:2135143-Prymnesium_polylepis.2